MRGFVYILKSISNGSYYVGSTNDLDRRVSEHTQGRSKYTREILPVDLVFCQEYPTLKMARGIERRLKRWKRKDIIERIVAEKQIKLGP